MKILVIDIDDTLILSPSPCRFFWLLAGLFQKIAMRLQKANMKLVGLFDKYDKVVILTGRDIADSEFTNRQLKQLGIHFDRTIFCPRTNLVGQWKLSVIHELAGTDGDDIWWIDDRLDKSIPTDELSSRRFHIVPLEPFLV
ncbi:MAG: hypothetical protein ABSD99_06395 [Candidatus Bathyarchaeia archaeon]